MRPPAGFHILAVLLLCVSGAAATPPSDEPPPIPIGYDAYRQWQRWPYLRIGQRTYMTSTYDRRGGNEAADASHFLYQLAEDRNVSLDVAGPGILVFARYNHWHGSPWHYIVDGRDHVVQESSTANPEQPVENSVFLPESAFPNPLTWTWSITRGADLSWVPIPFEKWFTMAYGRTHYGTGYYIYQKFLPDAVLSTAIKSWSPEDTPPEDVIVLLRRSGEDLCDPLPPQARVGEGRVAAAAAREVREFFSDSQGPATVRCLRLVVPESKAAALGEARLRIYWDGAALPSVDAPVKLLFGTGSLYNRDGREYLVKAFPATVRFKDGEVAFSLYFPMPFMRTARMELVAGAPLPEARYRIVLQPYTDPPNWVGQFHATYVDHQQPQAGRDLVFLDTRQVEGGGDWCGHFVGTSFIFSDQAVLTTLEGDPRFYFDDSNSPQAQGTGTEEWGGGGDYWGGRTMTLPFAGHPIGARAAKEAKNEQDLVNSAYRFLLADLMPFGKNARITFEHGGENRSVEHYQSVTYWYGRRGACLKMTDSLQIGSELEERRHEYVSPAASEPQTISSRYEWGPDTLDGRELYPESADTGRYMTGVSTFLLRLDPNNLGVLLRRKFDYHFPNQCARVSMADAAPDAEWHPVGSWYAAGSNRVVYSNPRGELGATEHNVQVSNRRWREDEFLLPRSLTQGREKIRVKIEFTPRNIPLFPGDKLGPQAWSEYRYTAYCYVMPQEQSVP